MAIVFSDIHGNLTKLNKALDYKPNQLHIFAGDAVDSWDKTPEEQEECLKILTESKCILIYGNHELSYHPTRWMDCSGWHQYGQDNFPKYLDDDRWKAAYAIDDYLITHAGLEEEFSGRSRSAKTMAGALNQRFKENHSTIYAVGRSRGGRYASGGHFWYDFRYDYGKLAYRFNQIFGHCSLRDPYYEIKANGKRHVCVNSDDRHDECWVFDTTEQDIVRL
jgi:hypothetical protein